MLPALPLASSRQQIDGGPGVRRRAADEQEFYDRYGADSIVGFFRFIRAVSEPWEARTAVLDRLPSEKRRQHHLAGLGPGRKQLG